MPDDSANEPRRPPTRPSLDDLQNQALALVRSGDAASLPDAQARIARRYGLPGWAKLLEHIDSLEEIAQLKQAIDTNDLQRVQTLMARNPTLHRAPLGYGGNGPLTWVAECRMPWEPPGPTRLAMARWMIENGSDVHQGGDGPLMRAALNGDRIAMMDLLVWHGADVNAQWNGNFPILFAPCEAVDPTSMKWLLERGADPNCRPPGEAVTALDYLIATYSRSPELHHCIDLLLNAGAVTRYDFPGVMEILRGHLDRLREHLNADPSLIHRRFHGLDCGSTGARRLLLRGATLLHVAAEFGSVEAARILLDHGAPVDSRAAVDDSGVGGQTALFHAVTQFDDRGLPVARLLLERGANLSLKVKLPGHYERPDEVVECTPLGYALRFPGEAGETVTLLRARGAEE